MRTLALLLISALSLSSSSAIATVFTGNHSLVIVADGVEDGGLTAPPGFFDDFPVGTLVVGSSQYDDAASVLFPQCFNPNDAGQCYPVYGGGSFNLAIGAEAVSSNDLDAGGPFVILDDVWSFDPASFTPIPPLGEDLVGLTFFYGSPSTPATLSVTGRWAIESIGFYLTLPADTILDPVSINGVDLYSFGQMNLSIHLLDLDTGNKGTVFALVPEPGTALLLGLGLTALAVRRGSDAKVCTSGVGSCGRDWVLFCGFGRR
jgi:hypothetical protein